MKLKIIGGSIFAAGLIFLVSFASVVGFQTKQDHKRELSSPLFSVRAQRAIDKTPAPGMTAFIGKGTTTHLFPSTGTSNQDMINRALQIFRQNPKILEQLLNNLDHYPAVIEMLSKYGITPAQVHSYLIKIQENPSLLEDDLINIQFSLDSQCDSQPLGLSTSSSLGCFIVAIVALVPITVVLTLLLLLFTIRIFTCLNINDCANNLANQIWSQLIQGLTQE
jgi:hypothetical protein